MIVGRVEYSENGEIVGWAFSRQFGDDQLLIEAFLGDRLIGMATADLPRVDGQPETDGHGFRINLHRPLLEEAIAHLAVYATALSGERALLPRSADVLNGSSGGNSNPAAGGTTRYRAPGTGLGGSGVAAGSLGAEEPGSATDVFVHIPKSGGSTIRTILAREYGVEHILYVEPGISHEPTTYELDSYVKQQTAARQIRLVTGHQAFGVHAYLKGYCRYFSMIRDPIERCLSDYYYAYSSDTHRHRAKILSGELTPVEFLTRPDYGGAQGQLKMLAASGPEENLSAAAAIENALISFSVVGVAERFAESILLMAKILGWRPPLHVPTNVTRLGKDLQSARQRVRVYAHAYCYDQFKDEYEVYTAIDRMLSQRISEEGEPFWRALDAFREIEADISARAGDRVYEKFDFLQNELDPGLAHRYAESAAYSEILDYLRRDEPRPRVRNYVGQVDQRKDNAIVGWAGDLSHGEPIPVTIRRAAKVVGRVICDGYREDLARAGYPRANLGFEINLEQMVGDPRDYAICFEETSIRLPGSS